MTIRSSQLDVGERRREQVWKRLRLLNTLFTIYVLERSTMKRERGSSVARVNSLTRFQEKPLRRKGLIRDAAHSQKEEETHSWRATRWHENRIDCAGRMDIGWEPVFTCSSSVTLQVNDVKAYLAKVGAGSLCAGRYRRFLEEDAQGSLQKRRYYD